MAAKLIAQKKRCPINRWFSLTWQAVQLLGRTGRNYSETWIFNSHHQRSFPPIKKASLSLFRPTNMAAVTSHANDLFLLKKWLGNESRKFGTKRVDKDQIAPARRYKAVFRIMTLRCCLISNFRILGEAMEWGPPICVSQQGSIAWRMVYANHWLTSIETNTLLW